MSSARQRPRSGPITRQGLIAGPRQVSTTGFGLPLRLGAPVLGALLLVTPLLAGCGTGQVTQTASQLSAVDGAQGDAGPIAVRNVLIAYPDDGRRGYQRGADAALIMTIANTGSAEDELASASSPSAELVKIDGPQTLAPQGTLRAVSAPAGGSGTSVGGPSRAQLRMVLTNLAEDVRPGRTVRLTLLFRQAGQLTLDVPVGPPGEAG